MVWKPWESDASGKKGVVRLEKMRDGKYPLGLVT